MKMLLCFVLSGYNENLDHLKVIDLSSTLIWYSSSISLAGVRLNFFPEELDKDFTFPSPSGSYEGITQALHYGTGATDVHAYRPLQRERAFGGPGGYSRQDRAAGLGGDREARGGDLEPPHCENGSPVDNTGEDVSGGAKGFTQLENRKQRGWGCWWVAACHHGRDTGSQKDAVTRNEGYNLDYVAVIID